jgi:hypothetical protein
VVLGLIIHWILALVAEYTFIRQIHALEGKILNYEAKLRDSC